MNAAEQTQKELFKLRREQRKRLIDLFMSDLPLTEKQADGIMRIGFEELIARQRLPGEVLTDEELSIRIYTELEQMEALQ